MARLSNVLRPQTGYRADLRAAHRTLDLLGLGTRFTLNGLHRAVEQHVERTVHLLPWRMPTHEPIGMWVAGKNAEYVFYDQQAPPTLRAVIIGHELAHVLYDNRTRALSPAAHLGLRSSNAPQPAAAFPHTARFGGPNERRAETFGTVAVERMNRLHDLPLPTSTDTELLHRLVATLSNGHVNVGQ